ncbi:hypothetical protein DEU56DRAFT_800591 [Suillus clintonianus]|uniref:uncharacterized protein n=1 Tax=Suillus clintonianus TaxID=1904413 RepID=UPI001B876DC7|nr:uncharacterized protein DEU56DRAFT_800591 [Suillus clintonianus]KAG2139303.1 hypothetical protein DEU56DRAFT_800591 [Suillus clintonianus]
MLNFYFTFLALPTFLVGANAGCVKCPYNMAFGGMDCVLVKSTLENNGDTLCTYHTSLDTRAFCVYSDEGQWINGLITCERMVDTRGECSA